jgi:cytochrome b561
MWLNNHSTYGSITIILHWLSAFIVFFLFFLGIWMVELSYVSQWYKDAPHWHKSISILLCILTSFRFIWRSINTMPKRLPSHTTAVHKASKYTHLIIYMMLFIIFISGYLISTSDGRAILVFNWFEVTALGELFDEQTDIAGLIHKYTAYSLIILSLFHITGALKHHFFDKDQTLIRMLKIK